MEESAHERNLRWGRKEWDRAITNHYHMTRWQVNKNKWISNISTVCSNRQDQRHYWEYYIDFNFQILEQGHYCWLITRFRRYWQYPVKYSYVARLSCRPPEPQRTSKDLCKHLVSTALVGQLVSLWWWGYSSNCDKPNLCLTASLFQTALPRKAEGLGLEVTGPIKVCFNATCVDYSGWPFQRGHTRWKCFLYREVPCGIKQPSKKMSQPGAGCLDHHYPLMEKYDMGEPWF